MIVTQRLVFPRSSWFPYDEMVDKAWIIKLVLTNSDRIKVLLTSQDDQFSLIRIKEI